MKPNDSLTCISSSSSVFFRRMSISIFCCSELNSKQKEEFSLITGKQWSQLNQVQQYLKGEEDTRVVGRSFCILLWDRLSFKKLYLFT